MKPRPIEADPVTVLMPVHNEAGHLARTVRSVLGQTHERLRLLLVDDGSTDGTAAELSQFLQDDRVAVISKPNGGIADTLNVGLRSVSTEYVARIDAGDLAAPWWLASQLGLLTSGSQADLVFGRVLLADSSERPFYVFPLRIPSDPRAALRRGKSFPHPFVVCRTHVLSAAGGYPLEDGIEDFLLWRTLADGGCRMLVNRDIVGLQVRDDAHNEVIEQRLALRYRAQPRGVRDRAILRAYVERLIIYPTVCSDRAWQQVRRLSRRYPLSACNAMLAACAMRLLARRVIRRNRERLKNAWTPPGTPRGR